MQTQVTLKPKEVFRVPLTWMMLDSCVDMYILKEEKQGDARFESQPNMNNDSFDYDDQEVLLVKDIASKFDKCADDRPDLLC